MIDEHEKRKAIGTKRRLNIYSHTTLPSHGETELVEEISLPLHVAVFHECNHLRHYLKDEKTYYYSGDNIDIARNNVNGNGSSLNIKIIGLSKREGAIMQDSEEELQLTGLTTIKEENNDLTLTIKDKINETAYRLYDGTMENKIRFPYVNALGELLKISNEDLKTLLKCSLGKT